MFKLKKKTNEALSSDNCRTKKLTAKEIKELKEWCHKAYFGMSYKCDDHNPFAS